MSKKNGRVVLSPSILSKKILSPKRPGMKYATTRSDALDTYIFNDKDNLNSEAYGVVIAVPPGPPHR
jgi:hypothetical protein